MEKLDKRTIKALAADTRVEILKSLGRRRKLPSELSRSLGLAPSTVVEHLKVLEQAELVSKQPRGPKWIYYELTERGRGVVQPETPFRFVLSLLVGGGLTFLGAFQLWAGRTVSLMAAAPAAIGEMREFAPPVPQVPVVAVLDWIGIAFLAAGLVLLGLGIFKLKK